MKSHAGQLPFACATCKAVFSQRRQLVLHSNREHGGQVVEEGAPLAGPMEQGGSYSEEFSLVPVSLMGEEGLEEGAVEEGGHLVDLLGQTIVLIQVPGAGGQEVKEEKPAIQF